MKYVDWEASLWGMLFAIISIEFATKYLQVRHILTQWKIMAGSELAKTT
jgi:hypothetical protein